MDLLDAYQKMITTHGWAGTAATLGMSRSALEARVYEVKGSGMRVQTALLIQSYAGTTHFAEAVCHASGGMFVALPVPEQMDNEALMSKFLALSSEFGKLSKDFADAVSDDVIDRKERTVLEADGAQLQRLVAELLELSFRVYCPRTVEAA